MVFSKTDDSWSNLADEKGLDLQSYESTNKTIAIGPYLNCVGVCFS